MNVRMFRTILVTAIVLLLIAGDADARRGSSSRRSGWGLGSRSSSRTTPRPRPQSTQTRQQQHQQSHQQSHGSTPDKIGWNVPDSRKPVGTNTANKPSAPEANIAKTSATNVQSGYSPSGGYPKQPASNPYHQSASNPSSGGYNPSLGQGYNPSVGGHMTHNQPYNPPAGHYPSYNQPYNPSGGHPYNPSGGHPYNPSYSQPYNPSYGQQPYIPSYGQPSYGGIGGGLPQQTVLVQSQSKGPGLGQLAKEAFVFAGVSAGVNAAVNRILPGGIYGTRGSSGSGAPPASHTEITYNNYYNNGTAPVQPAQPGEQVAAPAAAVAPATNAAAPAAAPPAPAAPGAPAPTANANAAQAPATASNQANSQEAAQQNNPNPLGYVISNDDIKKLSEDLFSKDKNNAFDRITMNLQGQKKDDSTNDDAPEPLLTVKDEAYEIQTIKAVLALHDNYELDVKTKESVTSEERKEEDELLDKFLETDVMKSTMKFLASKGYIPDDEYEFKDTLKRIWFSQFKRIDGDASSSGFETVFLAEQFDSDIIGLHNWIYYAKQEAAKKLDYLGYIKEAKLGDKAAIVKLRSSLNGIVQPVTTIFVGTSPELEMALYTVCFFTRPNNVCPVTLGGQEFIIIANRVNYFGKDIMISAYPDI